MCVPGHICAVDRRASKGADERAGVFSANKGAVRVPGHVCAVDRHANMGADERAAVFSTDEARVTTRPDTNTAKDPDGGTDTLVTVGAVVIAVIVVAVCWMQQWQRNGQAEPRAAAQLNPTYELGAPSFRSHPALFPRASNQRTRAPDTGIALGPSKSKSPVTWA